MSLYGSRSAELLQIHGLSRTSGRIALLKILAKASSPLPIERLQEQLSGELSTANLYRALEAFEKCGIVARFEFDKDGSFYELAHEKPHHHHIICERCGLVKDVAAHDTPELTKTALKEAPAFATIIRHSLEFYGQCTKCSS